MESPWFDTNIWAWLPGAVIGIAGAVLGALTGKFAPSGAHKEFLLAGWLLFKWTSVFFTVVGTIAAWSDQPYGVWYGLMLPGLIGIVVSYLVLPSVKRRYLSAQHSSEETET